MEYTQQLEDYATQLEQLEQQTKQWEQKVKKFAIISALVAQVVKLVYTLP